MNRTARNVVVGTLVALATLLSTAPQASAQCVPLTTLGSAYTQNFDTLSNVAGSTTNNLTILGWFMTEAGGGARDNEQYAVDTGASTTGDTYSYGAAGSTERALGQLRSGTLIPLFGACFTNNTGSTITSLAVAFNGEEWRLGTAARTDQMNFEYSLNATDLVTGTWTNVAALNFVTPDTVTTGAKNGNAAADRTALSSTVSSLSIANGATFWIRWNDTDASGADDGLAVDDFSLTPSGSAALPSLTVNDVSLNEGNAGTTSFTFTVSLSAPAGAGGVTFDVATADGTAVAPGDYTAKSLTGQTIPAGSSTYSFTVLVNGDTAPETNETFFVNVTNVVGANVIDGQGQGTIVNDDAAPNLTINDVTLAEGSSGTTTFTFTVSLSAPAGAGGVTFDIATADGTAAAPGDYTAKSLTGQTIPAGSSTYTFDVLVNGDTTPETNETFFVNVTNVTNAIPTDGQGLGTITNDDFTRIHDIQGPGSTSPVVGATVTTRGIVTGVKPNGFFIQEPDATVDADPATSEGILVFTSSAPPAAAVVGNLVEVTGTVVEYVPSADPYQPPLTELGSPTVVLLSSGNPLPAPVLLTASFPAPAGAYDQLERLEGMRVSLPSLTVVGPTTGSVNEANATATSSGVFYGVATGNARPFREAGIRPPDPAPAGSIPPIPRWDGNPELIRVDSDGQTGATALNLGAGAVVTGLVGPLDYSFRYYTILPDPASPPSATGGPTPTPVTAPLASEFTVASYNLERFFDTVNDPAISEPVLTATAFNARLTKASLGIRDFMRTPDVVGVIEVENLSTLQALATQINNDAVAASQPNPLYQAYLIEGNDVGGIDVGLLVKTATVYGTTPRVTVNAVVQELDGTLFVNPDSSTETLNDRPPLRLDAVVNHPNGASFPVTVIVNHLRSLNGVDDNAAGSSGWTTAGARVRAKRLAQAADLANLVQARQTANPAERIVLVGDFNAFDVNDGYVDSMATIAGAPVPDAETVVPGDGVDLVDPNLANLVSLVPAAQRYSFVFDGSAQNLDHVLVNAPLVSGTLARRLEHARVNADFPETARNLSTVERLSDHEPLVSFYQVAAFQTADLAVTKTDSPDPVVAGTNLGYSITVTNNGPDAAAFATLSDTLPAGTTFVSLAVPGGWSCSTPAVGAGGTVSCTNASLAVGSASFTLTVSVGSGVPNGAVISNTATVSSPTADGNAANNSATATTAVNAQADLSVTLADAPDPVTAGNSLTWTAGVSNAGPSAAGAATFTLPLPAGTTFVSLAAPGGWSCTTPAVGGGGAVSCSIASLAPAAAAGFTLVAATDPALPGGSSVTATATVSSPTTDPTPGNNAASAATSVVASSGVAITLSAAPEPVQPGAALAWTVTLTNSGPSAATNVAWSDALPAGTTFTSLNPAASWSCTAPASGTNGTVSCSLASFPVGSASFTINGAVAATTLPGTAVSNTAAITAVTGDTDPGDNTATFTSHVVSPAVLSATKTVAGTAAPGGTLTYTLVLRNTGSAAQFDNPGNELVDVLPAALALVSANATSGAAAATVATNTVTWNGSLPAGGSVTITIVATVLPTVTTGQVVTNQATVSYDADGNGTNEASAQSDDPSTAAPGDGTSIRIALAADGTAVVPTAGGIGLAALALLVALGGALVLGRRLA